METNCNQRMRDAGCRGQGQGMQAQSPTPRIPHPASLLTRSCMLILALIVVSVTTTASAVDVKLRERVVPKSSVVRLGDVAEISSADRQQARQLAAVPLMPAPAPDTERFLRKREVADMLAANGVELGEIRFDGAEQVAISAPAGVRTAAMVESRQRRHARESSCGNFGRCECEYREDANSIGRSAGDCNARPVQPHHW